MKSLRNELKNNPHEIYSRNVEKSTKEIPNEFEKILNKFPGTLLKKFVKENFKKFTRKCSTN